MNAKTFNDWLLAHHACPAARKWTNGKTARQAYRQCPRGDWLLWAAGKARVDRKLIVRAACACARLALPFVPKGEDRPFRAIETAEAWCDDKVSLEDVKNAASAAYATSAASAARAARAAAYAADAAADAAAYAADAANAASEVNGQKARKRMHRNCADAVRKIILFKAFNLNEP